MKKLTIFIIVFASLAGVGLLTNLITLDVQPFGIFASLTDLPGSQCSCEGEDGTFSPDNCQGFTGDYVDTNGVCSGLSPSMSIYGIPASDSQGCSATFWSASADDEKYLNVWPAGYSPEYHYNSMFQTTVELSELVQEDNDTNEEEQVSQATETSEITSDEGIVENSESVDDSSIIEDEEIIDFNQEVVESSETVETFGETVEEEDVETVGEDIETESVETVGQGSDIEDSEIIDFNQVMVDESAETENVETIENSTETSEVQQTDQEIVEESIVDEQNADELTLVRALNLQDGGLASLLRESVAAMLNAAHPDVNYPHTVPEIMSMAQVAIASGDYDKTIDLLKKSNDKNNSPLCRAGIQSAP